MIQRNFKLALTAGRTIPLVIPASQYDSGEQWIFTLIDETGAKYTPESGAIIGIKSDKMAILNAGTVDAAGRVVINETEQMTAAVGKNVYEILINDQTHGSANFIVMVEPRPGDNADFSDSDLSLLQQAIDGTSETAIKAGVQEWMDDNLTSPTNPIVDASLSISGAAADAKKTGDEISSLKSAIDYIVEGEQYQTPIIGDYDGTRFVASTNRAYVYCPLENIKTISIASGFQFSPRVNETGVGSAFSPLKGWTSDPYDISAETRAYLLVMVRKSDNSNLSENELTNVVTFKSKLSVTGLGEDVFVCESKADNVSNLVGLKWFTGTYIFADGSEAAASDRACTDFIPCQSNISVTYVAENNNANVYGIAFYDSSYKSVGGFKNNGTLGEPVTVTTPNNTAYLRLSTKTTILDSSYIAFNGKKSSSLLALSQKAYNPVVYVDGETGNDSTGDGRATNPYKTIQHCIDLGYERIGILVDHICSETITATTGTLHLFGAKKSWNSQYPNRVRAKINGNSTISTALAITGLKKVVLEDLEIYGCTGDGCKLDGCNDVQIVNCSFHDNGNNGIVLDYTNGVIRHSTAYNNARDGFNMNYYGDTQFFDCTGYNNGDDGISHHQGCTGLINGGEWYGNTKGGVASPANGADVDIMNVYSHDNGYGIWGNADSGTEARTFHVWNSVLVNNTQYGITSLRNTAILYNCKVEGNTVGQTSGNVNVL